MLIWISSAQARYQRMAYRTHQFLVMCSSTDPGIWKNGRSLWCQLQQERPCQTEKVIRNAKVVFTVSTWDHGCWTRVLLHQKCHISPIWICCLRGTVQSKRTISLARKTKSSDSDWSTSQLLRILDTLYSGQCRVASCLQNHCPIYGCELREDISSWKPWFGSQWSKYVSYRCTQ